jgi:N-acyl-phosphatidylethanolamine-hydrolysing phospholipase D
MTMKKLGILSLFSVSGVLLVLSCMHIPVPFDEAGWRKQVDAQPTEMLYAPHFEAGRYFNPWMPMEHGGPWRFLRWRLSRKATYAEEEKSFGPRFIPELSERIRAMPEGNFIAWIGHSTFLLRIRGDYWITDPMFSERALLPKRITPPAITGDALRELTPRLNVLISHNHYDHLDADSIRSLHPESRIYTPLGLKKLLESFHNGLVQELDWWQEIDLGEGKRLVCLPAQHWSRRIGQGRDQTLWASYLLISPETSVYFGGDSGYFIGYREIGRRFPQIDYALLATTAYHPRWFMHYAHMNIPEALQAFRDLGAKHFIPTQWGTFALGDEPPGFPGLDLMRRVQEDNLDPSRFILPGIGEILPLRQTSAAKDTPRWTHVTSRASSQGPYP